MSGSKLAAPRSSKKNRAKTAKELEALKDIADDVIESDFVPYACLFDPSTIATKDAELVQTIKITGLGYDGQAGGDLRVAIRTAIKRQLPDARYAVWLHTLRRRQKQHAHTHYPDAFSGKLEESWRALNPQTNAFTTELYVSIIRASAPVSLKSFSLLRNSLSPKHDGVRRSQELMKNLGELNKVVANILATLQPFGARLLTTVERNGIYYNEQMEFLEKLINLEERPMPLPERDLSHVLTSGEITFGFNAMEVRSADGHRRFAAIMTIKEYKESTLKSIDKFLEIPCELIVSQSFDFTAASEAHEAYQKQANYLTYSGDKDLAKWIEIDRLMNNSDTDPTKAYGHQQTTVFLIAPNVNQLESNVRMVQRALSRLGMVSVREDLRFEECYWSQLPANFTFISRKQSVDTDHLAGFVNLQAAPMGNAAGSAWGPPVTLFTTAQDSPYYFNFHRNHAAHTLVLGKPGTGKTSFTHFLIAQARKLQPNIWYLDARGRSAPFIKAMGGNVLTPGTPDCKLNPLQLAENPANREFLTLWLSTLLDPTGRQLNQTTFSYFQSVIDRVLQYPKAQRRMSLMIDIIRQDDPTLATPLQRFAAGGIYGELFDMPEDNFAPSKLCSWQLGRWMKDPATRSPLTGYLLHRLTGMLDRSPTLFVLDEGFEILETPLFSARVAGWYDYLTQNNAAVLLCSERVEDASLRHFSPAVAGRSATIFAMADRDAQGGYTMGFGLTAEEVSTLAYLDPAQHYVLQKRGAESVVVRAALNNVAPDILQTLSGRAPAMAASPADALAALMGYQKQVV